MAKAKKDMTPKERREQLIKDRADRLAKDAAKQGITPAQLAKKKKDTYLNVVGGAITAIPLARVMQLANTAYKAYKGAGAATKVAQATKTGTKATKTAAKTKPASTKTAAKTKTPATAAASKSNRATSQGGRTAAQARQATKTKPAPKSKAAQSKTPAKPKSRKMTPASSTRVDRAKRALLGGAVTSATLATIDDIRKSGKDKAKAAPAAPPSRPKSVPTPKPRPKRSTGMSEGNTVAGMKGKKKSTPMSPGNTVAGSSGRPKKKVDTSREQYRPGTNNKGLPAGAKRKFGGSYNSKKEKLRNIGGKTYVFNK